MTFDEAVKKLIDDPTYPVDFSSMTLEDQQKLKMWASLCNFVLGQGSIVEEWWKESEIVKKETDFGEL